MSNNYEKPKAEVQLLNHFTKVERIEEADSDVDNKRLWAAIDAITTRIPQKVWKTVPMDLAENHDRYI